jgi:DNA mismatch repair protein MutS
MMAQWLTCKEKAKDALLFFRLGDFYEAFHDDAVTIAKEINLTLTKRHDVPMCGVPFHSAEGYIDKLVAKGYKVAIAEQLQDPREVKGIVERGIVRTVTPGTLVTSSLLSEKSNNYLASLTRMNVFYGLAVIDLTTSEFRVMEIENEKELMDELCRLRPSELIISEKLRSRFPDLIATLKNQLPITLTLREEWHFDHEACMTLLLKHFKVHTLDGFGLKGMVASINAAGALLSYITDELNLSINHIEGILPENLSSYMALDASTQRHLELVTSLSERKETTLLGFLDTTFTPMGGRMLKKWVLHPLLDPSLIKERQETIQAIWDSGCDLAPDLKLIRDLERLIMRISNGYASPRDVVALRFSLEALTPLIDKLRPISSTLIQQALSNLPDLSEIATLIKLALNENQPFRLSDGDIFRTGYHEQLDELRAIISDSQSWIAQYQTHLRETLEIKTLKVGFTKVFGYYIDVSRGQSHKMPDSFQRRQTLVNSERFISPELKEYENKALSAEEKIGRLEQTLFQELTEQVSQQTQAILFLATTVAKIDCLHSLALVAKEKNFVCPIIDSSTRLDIQGGRHPIVEDSLKSETFIPNDTLLDKEDHQLILLTGPNMSGKSTYMRQVALIVILAQMGSFVPASKAHIGIVDKVFTRIGASDDLSRGQSTFMVEMAESANILHNATARSLVILDEIGRGTSTFDGISIAWAVAEYLLTHKDKGAKTLFATHYFELTELEGTIPGAVNYNVAVKETDDNIVFLHKIEKGSADRSYGIHVAKLAGLPSSVLLRATERLKKLERQHNALKKAGSTASLPPKKQLTLFEST